MNLDAMLRDDGYRTETLRGRGGSSLPRNLNIFLAGRSRNLALESRGIIISVNILLSSSSLLFNSKSKFKLSLHSLFLFFPPQFFSLHPPQPDYISSRFDRVSGWEYRRRGSNDALMTAENGLRSTLGARMSRIRTYVRDVWRGRTGKREADGIRGIRPVFTIDRRIIIP